MVKVYIADTSPLTDTHLYRHLYESANAKRRLKADRFLFQKDKMLSIGAWTLLCYALKEEGIREFSIENRQNNKPYLAGLSDLYFNLSHSGHMVMCAIADNEVGCDVEEKTSFDSSLAEAVMTKEELHLIYQKKEYAEQMEMFFRLWTLKESYMKATGLGMELAPHTFGISLDSRGISLCRQKDEKKYSFKEYHLDNGYCYSCCALKNKISEHLLNIDLSSL